MERGLTLIELIILLFVFSALGAAAWYLLDPLELGRRERDAVRLADLAILTQSVNRATQEASISATKVLCPNLEASCAGRSDSQDGDIRNVSGKGWVKVDLSSQKGLQLPLLPLDPFGSGDFFYEFYSDGTSWEINAKFESNTYRSRMSQDGGDNNDRYEVGTNLTLVN